MTDSFTKFFRHIMSMRQLTKVELVNTYWQQAHEIAETGRLAFIIRGNAAWESERPEGVNGGKGLWLKSIDTNQWANTSQKSLFERTYNGT